MYTIADVQVDVLANRMSVRGQNWAGAPRYSHTSPRDRGVSQKWRQAGKLSRGNRFSECHI